MGGGGRSTVSARSNTGGARWMFLCGGAVLLAFAASAAAWLLLGLIAWVKSGADLAGGGWRILVPALGGLGVALIARYGTRAVQGHGIPEVMQQVLANRSRISPRVMLLKPLASALVIGTGGPFGAEGPVIATGGGVGSLLGQLVRTTATERKIFLGAGAAAGMTAVFGTPLAATLLAVELLLFEFRARSVLPVALAAAVAQAIRVAMGHGAAEFSLGQFAPAGAGALAGCVVIGLVCGVAALGAERLVHGIEGACARTRVPWFWWPVIGGLVVGLIGWIDPRVLGPGYADIHALLDSRVLAAGALTLGLWKLLAWSIALGSGTAGGTLAPMLVVGGAIGTTLAGLAQAAGWPAPPLGLAALAGMVAFFAAGSRAFLASVLIGLEMTSQAGALPALLAAAVPALLVSYRLSAHSLMTAAVAHRGVSVTQELGADALAAMTVGEAMEPAPTAIDARLRVGELAARIGAHEPEVSRHEALLVGDEAGELRGVITRRDLLQAIEAGRAADEIGSLATRAPVTAHPDEMLDVALARMHAEGVGRLPVVSRENPRVAIGYLGRAALLGAARRSWADENERERGWLEALPLFRGRV